MVDIEMRAGAPGASPTLRRPGEPRSQGGLAPLEQDQDDLEWRGPRSTPPRAKAPRGRAQVLVGGLRRGGGAALGLAGLAVCIAVACSLGGGGGGHAGGGEGPRPAPHAHYVPPGVGESGRLPFGSAAFYGEREAATIAEWECACQQDCEDPVVEGIMERSGKDCPAAGGQGLLISTDPEDCRLAMPFVTAAGTGKTCVSRDAVESSCKEVLDGWWDAKFGTWRGAAASVGIDEVLERFARDIHDLPLLRWAEQERAGKSEDMQVGDFLAYVQPRCVEMVLRVFAAGELTQLSGSRLFDAVFEGESPRASTPPSIVDLTYGWLRDDVKARLHMSMHSTITVSGKREKEHYQFKGLRKQFGVPDSFLDEGDGEIDSDFVVTCEPLSDPHAQVRWRSFHVLAKSYFEHMENNPDSLLPRVYSAWVSETEGDLCYAVQSLVPGRFVHDEGWSQGLSSASLFWELKGSSSPKEYPGQQRHRYPSLEGADLKRDHVLILPAQIREELVEQLGADTRWLSQNGIMGYSLQLLRVKVGDTDADTLGRVCPGAPGANGKMHRAFFQQDGGFSGTAAAWDSCIYLWAIGLGNTLQPYSLYEALFAAANRVVHPGLNLTDVDPETYSESLQASVMEHSKSEIEVPPGVDSDVAPRRYRASFIHQKCSESQDGGEVKTPHLPACETVGLAELAPGMSSLLEEASRDFTEEEVQAARNQSNAELAPCLEGAAPASFVVGPSAMDGDLAASPAGAVRLDRDIWRAQHRGYQELVRFAQRFGCAAQSGREAVDAAAVEQERRLLEEVTRASCRKAVVVRSTCSAYRECEEQIQLLKARGYRVSVEGRAGPRWQEAASPGEYFDPDRFDLSVAAMIPVMLLGNGECSLSPRPSVNLAAVEGPNSEEYDPFGGLQGLDDYRAAVLDATAVGQSELLRAEKRQGLDAGSRVAKSFCGKGVQLTADHLGGDTAAIMRQLAVLCRKQEAGSIPPLRFEPVIAGSRLGFELKAMENLMHGVTVEALHPMSVELWRRRFAGAPAGHASYLVPLGAVWQAFNSIWGISASVHLDTVTLEMYKTLYIPTFCSKYEIKGVPTFHGGRAAGVYGDASWVSRFASGEGRRASVGVAQEHWGELVTHLAEDLDLLQSAGSVGYSMLVSVFEDTHAEPDPDAQNPLGKRAWQAFNFETQDLEVVLFGGVVDYLQTAEVARLEGRVLGTDIGSELVESSGVYACRLLLFISTQMLAPCRWPESESTPSNCVKDWTEAFDSIFNEPSEANTFLPQICEKFDGGPGGLKRVAAGLLAHADERLDSNDRPCVRGFRAPERCVDRWTYRGEEYTQCAHAQAPAPWCSWEPELPEHSGPDGPWSLCAPCAAEDAGALP